MHCTEWMWHPLPDNNSHVKKAMESRPHLSIGTDVDWARSSSQIKATAKALTGPHATRHAHMSTYPSPWQLSGNNTPPTPLYTHVLTGESSHRVFVTSRKPKNLGMLAWRSPGFSQHACVLLHVLFSRIDIWTSLHQASQPAICSVRLSISEIVFVCYLLT